jgi:hypothetical protein
MRKKSVTIIALAFLVHVAPPGSTCQAQAQTGKAPYPAMAPLDQYLMPDANSEIALARSAAPPIIRISGIRESAPPIASIRKPRGPWCRFF